MDTDVQLRPVDGWDTPFNLSNRPSRYTSVISSIYPSYMFNDTYRVPTPHEGSSIVTTRRLRRPAHGELRHRVVSPTLDDRIQRRRSVRVVDQLAVSDLELSCEVGVTEHGGAGGVRNFGAEVFVEVGILLRI